MVIDSSGSGSSISGSHAATILVRQSTLSMIICILIMLLEVCIIMINFGYLGRTSKFEVAGHVYDYNHEGNGRDGLVGLFSGLVWVGVELSQGRLMASNYV